MENNDTVQPSTNDIIMQSIEGLDGVEGPDGEPTETTETAEVETPVEEKKVSPEEKAKAEEEALEREMAELDKPAPKGKKANAIPHPRVKQMIDARLAKERKAWEAQVEKARKEEEEKSAPRRKKMEEAEQFDKLMDDPEKFLDLLVRVKPHFKPLLTARQQAQIAEPRPQPDGVNAAGEPAYSPEQFQKLLDWNAAQAVTKAQETIRKEMDAKYGPLEAEHKTRLFVDAQRPKLRKQVERAQTRYGEKMFNDNQQAISDRMQKENETDPYYTFEDACADVLLPLIHLEETEIRKRVMDEMEQRPAAAEKTVRQAVIPGDNDTPKTSRDIIAEIAKGLK